MLSTFFSNLTLAVDNLKRNVNDAFTPKTPVPVLSTISTMENKLEEQSEKQSEGQSEGQSDAEVKENFPVLSEFVDSIITNDCDCTSLRRVCSKVACECDVSGCDISGASVVDVSGASVCDISGAIVYDVTGCDMSSCPCDSTE